MLERRFLSSSRIVNWRQFAHIHLGTDLVVLAIAWYSALGLRLWLNPWMSIQLSRVQMNRLAPHPLIILTLWTAVAFWMGLYRRKKSWSAAHAIRQALESDLIVCALAIIVTFFSRGMTNELSRSFIFLFGPLSLIFLTLSFYAAMAIECAVEKRGTGRRRVAVCGAGEDVEQFMRKVESRGAISLHLTGVILPDAIAQESASGGGAFRVLGTLRQLAEVINRERLDQLICMSSISQRDLAFCGAVSNRMGVTVSRPLTMPEWDNVRYNLHSDYGLALLDAEPLEFTRGQEFAKRCMDLAASSILLLLLMPLLIVLAVLVRLSSKGPIFYRSWRVGKGGRHFTFWKFRSMRIGGPGREELKAHNENHGHLFKIRNDPRITWIGRLMRRYSLDELPQLYNVLIADMSLVGPRPLPAEDLDPDGLSHEYAHWAEQRTNVRPGITGIWQIRGRSDLSFEQMVECDLEYIRNWSLALDLQVLMETPVAVLSGRGAY
jgi:exopolysaccharide biosynthesis polyprenyl glycosylphosphotransferase